MNSEDLLKKVRTLEIKSKKLTNHLFSGEYHSAFKGRGMAFKEVKEYSAGDDIRFIDWNVSARMNTPYSKVFEEERELSVFLMIDQSSSSLFGTQKQTKKDLITEITASLAFSALKNNDRVGILFFSSKIEKYIPSRRGRDHVLYMLRELLNYKAEESGTNIGIALNFLNKISRRKSIVFLLSDFADENYEEALHIAAMKHDLIGVQVFDEMDRELPDMGLIELCDSETGETMLVDSSDPQNRSRYRKQFEIIQENTVNKFRTSGADLLQIATGADYAKILKTFFLRRR